MSTDTAFIEASRRFLSDEYPRKIESALADLTENDLWWRPNRASNAIGNLILHLAGNVRQWVVHGLGGSPDVRERSAEFERLGGMTTAQVMSVLRDAVSDADAVLESFEHSRLLDRFQIQGLEVRGLDAIYHVVEHFSMHTGQILYLAKMRTGSSLGFYEVDEEGRVTNTRW